MSYCINPNCSERCNAEGRKLCQNCGCDLLICDRYRIIKPLRELDGQHHTEVFEIDDGGTRKILKVLTSNRRRLVELFKQESKILAELKHLPISQLDRHFTFVPDGCYQKLRCLVMEKVEGQNLKQWLKIHGKIGEARAIDWLKQLLAILVRVHQRDIIHRDIKPSNIMIRPDGKLILIDFGTARKQTITYVEKLEDSDITRVYSPGYTAPEQLQGQAVNRSDFFALGRTMVHLMTGIYPDDLPKTNTDRLLWHDKAPQISLPVKKIIDRPISPVCDRRPTASEIFQLLDRLSQRRHLWLWHQFFSKSWQRGIALVFLCSMAIALSLAAIRHIGWLQPIELQAFDRLMHLRPIEDPDSRLLLIAIDEADIQYQNQRNMALRWSLSDEALAKLLAKIMPYRPRAVGIDIYRDFRADPNYPGLAEALNNSDRLYAVCKVPAPQDGSPVGTPPPPEIDDSFVGFSDFVADRGDIIRRQLLQMTPPDDSPCQAEYAFSLQLALHYLNQEEIVANVTPQGNLEIGKTIFNPLTSHSGGYRGIDAGGYQVLLNYRSLKSPTDIARRVSLRDILSDRLDSELEDLIENRLVIIGVTAASSIDNWKTPYSKQSPPQERQIPGMFIQAQMTSQIISAVTSDRPLFWWWSNSIELLWIGFWSLLGGILGWYIRRPLILGSAIAGSLLILFTICWTIFLQAGWIPLVPPALALILAAIATVFVYVFKTRSVDSI